MMEIDLTEMGKNARMAARQLVLFSSEKKNQFLETLAFALWSERENILEANAADVRMAKEKQFSEALIDRLLLSENRLMGIMADIRQLIHLPDPVGTLIEEKTLPNGLRARRQRVPMGVLAVIYEARPNVTVDITALALKSGNAVLLRGGKETRLTNLALMAVIHQVLVKFDLPLTTVQFIDDPDRRYVNQLVKMDSYVDLLIPRGGNRLQEF
jgi:glutamate-5-semialdehyde dehydrogenase